MKRKIIKFETSEIQEKINSLKLSQYNINYAKHSSITEALADMKSLEESIIYNTTFVRVDSLGSTFYDNKFSWLIGATIPSFSFKRGVSYKYKQKSKKLEELNIEELISLISKYSVDQYEYVKIQSLIIKKRFALWLGKIIKKLKRILKFLLNRNRIENKRDFFRKINCFYFKNLDDTHSFVAFN